MQEPKIRKQQGMDGLKPKIHKLLVPPGLPNHPGRDLLAIDYITIHETGNTSKTADAHAHARFQYRGGGGRQASWHYTVDENEIWQSFLDRQMCWHTGSQRGNQRSIGIEICVNCPSGFLQACFNTMTLVAWLKAVYGLKKGKILQHNHWSGKNCPEIIRRGTEGINWQSFLEGVKNLDFAAKTADSHGVILALVAAGVSFDIVHWRKVFEGRIPANRDWFEILCRRAIYSKWPEIAEDPKILSGILMGILGEA